MVDKECRCLDLCYFIVSLLICSLISVMSALEASDCKEFKLIAPLHYDRNSSSVNDITKRPLGYMFATAQYPVVQSNVENPCALLKNLTGRYVEVMVQTLVAGKSVCVRDNGTPDPNRNCGHGTISGCWNPSKDTMIYEFYCDPGEGCDTDVQFWYRLTPSPVGKDVDDWCNELVNEFPENLLTVPPPLEKTTTVKSASRRLQFLSVLLLIGLLAFTVTC
ncbi:uncharacterized protein [Montipora foliosa]|uniref:uncharacterized protein n=1 Tax=Montipora foliosa TaxID=591990 RepID=UPI0035F18920